MRASRTYDRERGQRAGLVPNVSQAPAPQPWLATAKVSTSDLALRNPSPPCNTVQSSITSQEKRPSRRQRPYHGPESFHPQRCRRWYIYVQRDGWALSFIRTCDLERPIDPEADHARRVHGPGAVWPAEIAPLPARAQFLNVIESVFSGMARAIIHNSDYNSIEAAKAAIDRYFEDRNANFLQNPKRAGKKVWGDEREPAAFSDANNCKDPRYR